MSSAAKTPATKKSAAKKAVKSQRKTINRQHQNQKSSFIYQKTALLKATKFSQKESSNVVCQLKKLNPPKLCKVSFRYIPIHIISVLKIFQF